VSAQHEYQERLARDPQDLEALLGLAALLGDRGDCETAERLCSLAVALDPQCVGAWAVLGGVQARLGNYRTALHSLDRALALGPDCPAAHWNRAFVLLLQGDYRTGWADYEWGKVNRIRRTRTLQPEWDGSPMGRGGSLLLWAEQGAGDTFQFVRFVQRAKEQSGADRVLLEVPEELVPLLHGQVPAEVYAAPPAGDLPYFFNQHASLMSLPHLLGVTLEDVGGAPYLRPKGKAALPVHPAATRRVGLVWRGNPSYANDQNRSIHDPDVLTPLLNASGAQFYSLCVGHEPPPGVTDLTPGIADWTHTAALLQELDLLITTDSGIAHLAGALGRPVWLMLTYVPEFRWLLERDDSPWYSSVRIFRQSTPGDWTGVVERVAAALQELD
jgi:hypothetical protein